MSLINSLLLGIVALICLLGGSNIMKKGAMSFLPDTNSPQLVLDNLVRFLAGIYISSGILFAYAAFNTDMLGNAIYILGAMVSSSGLGRLYSRFKIGSAGKYFDYIMLSEILLGILIIIFKFLS